MNVSVSDTVNALSTVIAGLLPAQPDPALTPDIQINPTKTHPAGIGGYIGLHPEPVGEIHSRRMQAQVVIRVKAGDLATLAPSESAITNALLGANPTSLRSQGIHRIIRDASFGQLYRGAEDGLDIAAAKDISFDIDFEFKRLPQEDESVISTIPLDLLLHSTGNRVQPLFSAEFDTDPLLAFDAIDDSATSNGPGNWVFNSAEGRVEQDSSINGGSNGINASKRGTCLVLQPGAVVRQPEHFLLQVELAAQSGGIGVVYNFQDIDNFYFFIMSMPTPYRIFGKKVGGSFSALDNGAPDAVNGYGAGFQSLRLVQQNNEIQVALNGVPVLSASESSPPVAGSVGFFCRNCATAQFRSLRWLGL
jgi:hypothetical protein